jgi:hypothetical protein
MVESRIRSRSRSCHGDVCAVQRENGVGERSISPRNSHSLIRTSIEHTDQ